MVVKVIMHNGITYRILRSPLGLLYVQRKVRLMIWRTFKQGMFKKYFVSISSAEKFVRGHQLTLREELQDFEDYPPHRIPLPRKKHK